MACKKISCIITFDNYETNIENSIESVFNQSIGLENIQLIVINCGKGNDIDKIVNNLENKYEILLLDAKNLVISSTKNKALKYANGEYISFLNSGDELSNDFFEKGVSLFEKSKEDINIVAFPIKNFGSKNIDHKLNKNYRNTGIYNLENDYFKIHDNLGSFLIKSTIFNNEIIFDEKLPFGAEIKYILEIQIISPLIGVVSDSFYYFRKEKNNIKLDSILFSKDNYLIYLENFYLEIIEKSIEKVGYVPNRIQYTLLHLLQFLFNIKWINHKDIYTQEDQIIKFLNEIVKNIDFDLIVSMLDLKLPVKIFILELKLEKKISYFFKKGNIIFENLNKEIILDKYSLDIQTFIYKNNKLKIIIKHTNLIDYKMLLNINETYYEMNTTRKYFKEMVLKRNVIFLDYSEIVLRRDQILNSGQIEFFIEYEGNKYKIENLNFKTFSLFRNINNHRFFSENYLFENKKKYSQIIYRKSNLFNFIFLERNRLEFNIFKTLKIITKKNSNRKIWLISDRPDFARDNGEALFMYLMKNRDKYKNIIPYFVINKESTDFKRLSKIGNVVKHGSDEHFNLYIMADKIILSHPSGNMYKSKKLKEAKYKRWITADYVFLQHGILVNDLSNWLNKYRQNFSLFVTSSPIEFNSILNGNYLYNKKEVKLLGLARFDYLVNSFSKKKIITIFPTWRKTFFNKLDSLTGKHEHNIEVFLNSEFYKNFNKLLNSELLIKLKKDYNLEIEFVLHPNMKPFSCLFKNNKVNAIVKSEKVNYSEIANNTSCLLTDYSSFAFDVAYLKKKIIYFQFDIEHFRTTHIQEGDFDYINDGLGPVCLSYESILKEIENTVKNNFVIEKKYLDRIDNFYLYFDRNNSKRIVEAILEI